MYGRILFCRLRGDQRGGKRCKLKEKGRQDRMREADGWLDMK